MATTPQNPVDQVGTQASASGRSPLATLTGIQILSTGSFAPETEVTNSDLAALGFDEDWIIKRTGIRSRRKASSGTPTSEVAYEAAVRCLEAANSTADKVDLIIVATMTPDYQTPSTACQLQRRLGATAPAMDLNAACAGFVYGLVTGMQFIKTGTAKRVLVVGADLMSRTVNPEDRKTYPLFGDGAGAVLLGPSKDDQGFVSYTLGAEGSGGDALCIPAGGTAEQLDELALAQNRQFLQMDGKAVFKWAVRLLVDACNDVLYHAQLKADDIDLVVMHQANIRIIDSAIPDLGFDNDRVLMNLQQYGNTSAASIPLVLDQAAKEGRIERGDRILICGFGAGLAWGAGVFRW